MLPNFRDFPPYFHPTTVALIDDDANFLSSLRRFLKRSFHCRSFSYPDEGVQHIATAASQHPRLTHWLAPQSDVVGDDWSPSDRTVTFRPHLLRNTICDPGRFTDVSVAIIDYAMPGLDGLEVCRMLDGLPVKRLMLTGKTDELLAVRALNEGLIDGFLHKNDRNLVDTLKDIIARFQRDYFADIAAPLWPSLALPEPTFLDDPAVMARVRDMVATEQAAEYYFSAKPSGMLLADRSGQLQFILIQDEATVSGSAALARDCGVVPISLVELLAAGSHQPWFPTRGGFYDPSLCLSWQKYLYPAEKVGNWYLSLLPVTPDRLGLSGDLTFLDQLPC